MKRIIFLAFVITACFACAPKIPHIVKEPMLSSDLAPAPGRATVVFVRSSSRAAEMPFALHDNGTIIGVVKGGNCSIYSASPGQRVFDAFGYTGRNRYAFLEADLAADRTYYILVEPRTAPVVRNSPDLRPIRNGSEDWGNLPGWLAQCNVTALSDETLAWDQKASRKNRKYLGLNFDAWKKKTDDTTEKAVKPEDGLRPPPIGPAW